MGLRKTSKFIFGPITRLKQHRQLIKQNYSVGLRHEGNMSVKLPNASFADIVTGKGGVFTRSVDFNNRREAEALLRRIIYQLYKSNYLDATKSIIDIGSHIGDNSIVWATFLRNGGRVFAIDPSSDNLHYGRRVAELNSVPNVDWIEAVCSDKAGQKLDFDGDINHASFKTAQSESYLISTTLDHIIGAHEGSAIGFMHLDVEGFELSVLKGASQIVSKDKPVIAFEQHISQERVGDIVKYLKSFGYYVYMVNEVLPGCSLDCRNFLAVPEEKGTPEMESFEQSTALSLGVYSATMGPPLVIV